MSPFFVVSICLMFQPKRKNEVTFNRQPLHSTQGGCRAASARPWAWTHCILLGSHAWNLAHPQGIPSRGCFLAVPLWARAKPLSLGYLIFCRRDDTHFITLLWRTEVTVAPTVHGEQKARYSKQ